MHVTGSLVERCGHYTVILKYKDASDKRRQKWITTGIPIKNGKRKAEKRMAELIAEYSDAPITEPSKMLLCDFIKEWVESSEGRLSPPTYTSYESMINKHIYPYFKEAKVLLINVTTDIIQKYYNTKLKEGLSKNTVVHHHGVIRAALQYAVTSPNRLIKANPCDDATKPKRTKYYGEFYTALEMQSLLLVARGEPIEVPIFLAAYFGLRRSEVLGLKWNALDLSGGTLTVKHKIVRAQKDGKIAIHATDDLKTEASYRVLQLEQSLIDYLTTVEQRQEDNRKRNGDCHIHKYDDYVCVNELGDLIKPDYVTDKFRKILKQNDLKHIRFHDLRHSCASLLLSLGYTMKEVQEWLGHSNYLTTANLYSHVDPRNKKNMIVGLANALGS